MKLTCTDSKVAIDCNYLQFCCPNTTSHIHLPTRLRLLPIPLLTPGNVLDFTSHEHAEATRADTVNRSTFTVVTLLSKIHEIPAVFLLSIHHT